MFILVVTFFIFCWIVLIVGGVMWLFIKEEQDDVRQGEDI